MTRIVVALLATILLAWQGPAWPDPEGSVGDDWFEVSDEVQYVGDGPPGTADVSTSQAMSHTYQLACGDADRNLHVDVFECDTSVIRCGEDSGGFFYFQTAHYADGSTENLGMGCYDPQDVAEETQTVTPGLALRAFERVPLPKSEVVVQPPGGVTLVGLDTILSTRAQRFTETVRLLGRRVELDIRPASYRWLHGDGTDRETGWPGREWRRGLPKSSYISHVYQDRARLSVRVDTTWAARFRVGGGAWRDVPGTVTIEGEPTPLRVRSATPHLVGAAA